MFEKESCKDLEKIRSKLYVIALAVKGLEDEILGAPTLVSNVAFDLFSELTRYMIAQDAKPTQSHPVNCTTNNSSKIQPLTPG